MKEQMWKTTGEWWCVRPVVTTPVVTMAAFAEWKVLMTYMAYSNVYKKFFFYLFPHNKRIMTKIRLIDS